MKKTLTIILKSSISGAALLAKRMSHVKQKYLNFRNMRDKFPHKKITSASWGHFYWHLFCLLLSWWLESLDFQNFFTCKEKEAIYLVIFATAMIIHHERRCEIKTKTIAKNVTPVFLCCRPWTLFWHLMQFYICYLDDASYILRHFCFVTHLILIIRIVGNGA